MIYNKMTERDLEKLQSLDVNYCDATTGTEQIRLFG